MIEPGGEAENFWHPGRHRDLVLVLAAVATIWTIAASRWIITDTVVPWDAENQFYAFFRFLASTVHSGHAPFWNPYHYGGHPSVADPQSLIFSPPFTLWALFDPAPSMRAFDLVVFAHLGAGGFAVGGLGWRARWPMPASVLAAVIFMFGGPASGRLDHSGIILSYGLFPITLLLMQVALQRRSLLIAVAFGVVAALMALGRNQVALLLCFVLVAVFVADIAMADEWRCYLRERAAVLTTMIGVSAALLAVPLLLTAQFAALSNRPVAELNTALEASLYPANLASMAVADVMGSLETTQNYWGPNYLTLPAVGATDRSFNYLFVGAASTILVLWFGIAGGGMLRRANRVMSVVLLVALLYALGRYTPLYALAFHYVPGVNLFRRPIDAAFIVVTAFALIAGQLLADYVRDGIPRIASWRLVAVSVCALGMIGWAILFSGKSLHALASLWEASKVVPLALLVIALLSRARGPEMRLAAAACVAILATAELVWCSAASSLNAEPYAYYSVLENPVGLDAQALNVLEHELERRHQKGEWPRVEIVGVSGAWQNLAMVRGLEATNGYNPLRIGSYDRLVSPGETTYTVDQRLFPVSFDGYDCSLARELGLEYLVLGRPIEDVPHLRHRPVSDILLSGPSVWIYRLRRAEPRVKFVKRAVVVDAELQVRAGRLRPDPTGDTAQIDDETPPTRSLSSLSFGQEDSRARILARYPDRIEVEVNSKQPGMLVVHGAYYPGWTAEIDGRSTPILRADVLFRGVEMTEGHHLVLLRFQPFSLANLRNAIKGALAGLY